LTGLSRRRFLYAGAVVAAATGMGYLTKDYWYARTPSSVPLPTPAQTSGQSTGLLEADFDYKPKRKYISHSPDETIEFRNLTRFEGNRPYVVWSVDDVKASEDWDFSTQLTPGEHIIKLVVRNEDRTDSKLEDMEVDESGFSFPENQLNVRLKGVDFTPGFRDGAWKPLTEEQMEEDLDVINHELGCNAVRIFGDMDGLVIRCAGIALKKSFDCIVLAPRYVDSTVEETTRRVGTFAKEAEKLRTESNVVELCVANELSIEADLEQFLEVMRPLTEAGKLECVLAQLSPSIKFDLGRLESFLALVPKTPSFAVEFRHNSWLQNGTMKLLEKYKVAYTIVDEPLLPPDVYITSEVAYFRWHGRGDRPWFNYRYSEKELREWVPKIKDSSEKTKKVLGYFNNHFKGYAPENCLMMMQMLGTTTSLRDLTLLRLARQRMESKAAVKTETLEAWTGPIARTTSEKYLARLASPEILAKARLIHEKNISMREDSKKRLAAYVEETTVDLDLEKRTIIHSCSVWRKSAPEKKFCPHVAGLFLSVSPERAISILSSISSNLNAWKFESRRTVELPR